MLDIKLIRENHDLVKKNLKKRNDKEKLKLLDELLVVDKKWRSIVSQINELRQQRNKISQEIAELKKKGKGASKLLTKAKQIPKKIGRLENEMQKHEIRSKEILMRIPNLLHESVPVGKDDTDNVEVRRWGKPPQFNFTPQDHVTILKNLGLLDMESAAKVAGAGFYYLKNELALLDLALQKFAIDFLRRKGFILVEPPYMVNKKIYEAMIGDPTDFAEASYKIEGEESYLIPTAEYSAGSIFTDAVIDKKKLPIKICGVSPCFRKEVGTHGKYTKGLFRVHQFNKVEQFVLCLPEDSWKVHEEIQKNSEELYQQLGLHYRVVNVCTGDIGTKAAKKYDIECWMADGKFRETGSNSNVTDYQARRLNVKFREGSGKPPVGFVHALNNTAIATSRVMIAIVEQFQQKDGTVLIPKVLQPYMNGVEKLEKK